MIRDAIDWMNLGVEKKREGKYDEALSCYKKSEDMNPHDENLHKSFGKTYYIVGKYNDAVESYEKAIAISGCSIERLPQLGGGQNILMHMGHALIDKNNRQMSEYYRMSIDPYFKSNGVKTYKHSYVSGEINSYDNQCMQAAYDYLIRKYYQPRRP